MFKKICLLSLLITMKLPAMTHLLPSAPETIHHYHELVTQYNTKLPELWNNLTKEERIFAYYIYRASLIINRIYADQTHRHALEIIDIFEHMVTHKKDISDQECIEQAELFLIYLYAHHSQYFLREFEDHKRTPARLKLPALTPARLVVALQESKFPDAEKRVEEIHESLFKDQYEPTVVVAGSIEKSAGNFYARDFTDQDFEQLSLAERSALNTYCYIDQIYNTRTPKTMPYKIGGRYSDELQIAYYWLEKALQHAQKHPVIFDQYIPKSLHHLLSYIKTGNEEEFRKFSIEWLHTKSRIDFNWGFIEVYHDPKSYRGSAAADLTIKSIDMTKLNTLLPELEKQLPFPASFMRENINDTHAIPNASINTKIFAAGDLGPVKNTLAYCLPNYNDIRAQYGSKQIIYQSDKSLGQLINPALSRRLYFSTQHLNWLNVNDPHQEFLDILENILTILHETMGHGSGRLDMHTFVEGDPLTINGHTYRIGDTIPVTDEITNEFIGAYFSGLEELRAEIIALYSSIYNFDELARIGMFKDWPQKIGKEKIIEWLIIHMARTGLMRLVNQKPDATEIVQAHAQADTAILNYLLDHGELTLVEEPVTIDNNIYTVLDVHITDLAQAMKAVKELAQEVQRIKSTADGVALKKLMHTYGACVRHPEYITILKTNREALVGERKEIVEIYPLLRPQLNSSGSIDDIQASWPNNFLEQQLIISKLALSTDL